MKSATKQQHRSGQKVGFVLGLPKFNLESVILHEISEQYTNLDVMCLEWYFAKICALCVDQKSKMDVITRHILKIVPYVKYKKCKKNSQKPEIYLIEPKLHMMMPYKMELQDDNHCKTNIAQDPMGKIFLLFLSEICWHQCPCMVLLPKCKFFLNWL